MAIDTSSLLSPEQLFAGRASSNHQFNEGWETRAGKRHMYDLIEGVILEHSKHDESLRFMSLPGRFWRFEMRLMASFFKQFGKNVTFTGFERDPNIILSSAGYVPHLNSLNRPPKKPGYRTMQSTGIEYFKTNMARWISMDVNSALNMNDLLFKRNNAGPENRFGMQWWLQKFCCWDSVWLDYYGPASDSIGKALSNLYFHCRQDCTPVAVTILKGRESDHQVQDRKKWMIDKLSGVGSEFKELEYFEYSDSGSTMCNLIGLLIRKT